MVAVGVLDAAAGLEDGLELMSLILELWVGFELGLMFTPSPALLEILIPDGSGICAGVGLLDRGVEEAGAGRGPSAAPAGREGEKYWVCFCFVPGEEGESESGACGEGKGEA